MQRKQEQQSQPKIGQENNITTRNKDKNYNKIIIDTNRTTSLVNQIVLLVSHGPQDICGIPTLHCYSNSLGQIFIGILLLGCPLHLTSHLLEKLPCFGPNEPHVSIAMGTKR